MNRMNKIILCGLLLCLFGAGKGLYGQESFGEPIVGPSFVNIIGNVTINGNAAEEGGAGGIDLSDQRGRRSISGFRNFSTKDDSLVQDWGQIHVQFTHDFG